MKRNMRVRFSGLVKPSNIHRRNFYICYHPDDKGTYSVLSAEIEHIGESALFRGTVGSLDAPFSETLELSAASLLVMIVFMDNSLRDSAHARRRENVLHCLRDNESFQIVTTFIVFSTTLPALAIVLFRLLLGTAFSAFLLRIT